MTFKLAYGFMDEVIRDCLAGKISTTTTTTKYERKKLKIKHGSRNTELFFLVVCRKGN